MSSGLNNAGAPSQPTPPGLNNTGAPSQPTPSGIEVPDLPSSIMPSWSDAAKLSVPLLDRPPREAQAAVSSAFAWTVRRLRADDDWTYLRLFLFAKCVLRRTTRGVSDVAAVIRARAHCWKKQDGWVALYQEAVAAAPLARVGAADRLRYPLDDNDDGVFKHFPHLWSSTVDADAVPPDVLDRAVTLARRGYLGRAVSALQAAKIAPATQDTSDVMQGKHPAVDSPVVAESTRATARAQDIPLFNARNIKRALRGFKLGTSAGASGLTAEHLLSIACAPGSDDEVLSLLVSKFSKGQLPHQAAQYFCGARLVALVKKDGDLRPIAVGDILRRLTARLMLPLCRSQVVAHLSANQQVGVGVKGGLEAACHTARRVRHAWAQSGVRGNAFVKFDFSNAFNNASRSEVIAATEEVCPILLPFVLMLYLTASVLIFGAFVILSCTGVQQGDPLGPPLYCLVLARLWRKVKSLVSIAVGCPFDTVFDFFTWYLDDGTGGGPLQALSFVLDALLAEGPHFGIHVNLQKCEVVCADEDKAEATRLFPGVILLHFYNFDSWALLGSPMGSSEDHFRLVVARATTKVRLIAQIPDPHVGYVLLRFCAGFSLLVHLMRSCPPLLDVLQAYDTCVASATISVIGFHTPWIPKPSRLGGGGMRDTALHAHAAYIAASGASSSIASLFCPSQLPLPQDPLLPTVLASLSAAPFSCSIAELAVEYLASGGTFGDKQQRTWAAVIEETHVAALTLGMSDVDRARVSSSAGPNASAWLGMPIDDRMTAPKWLTSTEFIACIRFRFGIPVAVAPRPCALCRGSKVADIQGVHSVACIGDGLHTQQHHTLRTWLVYLASSANTMPLPESCCFSTRPSLRIDVLLRLPRICVDVALISPFAVAHIRNAIESPGQAATAYEGVKAATYGAAAAASNLTLVAFVTDALGAMSTSARCLLLRLARAKAARFDASVAAAVAATLRDFSVTHQRCVARLLLVNAASLPPPPGGE